MCAALNPTRKGLEERLFIGQEVKSVFKLFFRGQQTTLVKNQWPGNWSRFVTRSWCVQTRPQASGKAIASRPIQSYEINSTKMKTFLNFLFFTCLSGIALVRGEDDDDIPVVVFKYNTDCSATNGNMSRHQDGKTYLKSFLIHFSSCIADHIEDEHNDRRQLSSSSLSDHNDNRYNDRELLSCSSPAVDQCERICNCPSYMQCGSWPAWCFNYCQCFRRRSLQLTNEKRSLEGEDTNSTSPSGHQRDAVEFQEGLEYVNKMTRRVLDLKVHVHLWYCACDALLTKGVEGIDPSDFNFETADKICRCPNMEAAIYTK